MGFSGKEVLGQTSVIQMFVLCRVFEVLFLKWFLSMTVRYAQKPVLKVTLQKHCIPLTSELPTIRASPPAQIKFITLIFFLCFYHKKRILSQLRFQSIFHFPKFQSSTLFILSTFDHVRKLFDHHFIFFVFHVGFLQTQEQTLYMVIQY